MSVRKQRRCRALGFEETIRLLQLSPDSRAKRPGWSHFLVVVDKRGLIAFDRAGYLDPTFILTADDVLAADWELLTR